MGRPVAVVEGWELKGKWAFCSPFTQIFASQCIWETARRPKSVYYVRSYVLDHALVGCYLLFSSLTAWHLHQVKRLAVIHC